MAFKQPAPWRLVVPNPAALGLFSFALTTFVLNCYNAGLFGVEASDPVNAAVGLAAFYGGGMQAIAGMWAFIYGDGFAATAFSSYGAFWISYACFLLPSFGVTDGYRQALSSATKADDVLRHAKAIYLLGWTLFTFLMFLASTRTCWALCTLFGFVAATLTLLTAGEFSGSIGVHRAGGFLGILTALLAWYNALAELLECQEYPIFRLPLGRFSVNEKLEMDSSKSRSRASAKVSNGTFTV